jgi:hypothetical protein
MSYPPIKEQPLLKEVLTSLIVLPEMPVTLGPQTF